MAREEIHHPGSGGQNGDGHNRDPGLQPERTRQAWDRTLFVMLLDGIFFLRLGLLNSNLFTSLAGGLLLLLTLGVVVGRHFSPVYHNNGLHIRSPGVLAAVTLALIITGGLACLGIITPYIRMFSR